MAINAVEVPSIFHENSSPKSIGDIIALNIIVMHEVDAIKIMLPYFNAKPFNV